MGNCPRYCRIDKRYVHKVQEENVLIGDIRRISTDPEEFECAMIVDPSQPFFFEHPSDHVPGMMFTEAGRQVGIAVSHLFLNVPFGTHFVSREFKVRFETFAELTEPITIRSRFNNRCFKHGALSEAVLQGDFHQCGKVVCSMEGDWKMYSPEIYQRYREHEKVMGDKS
jgi:hypothetical protein